MPMSLLNGRILSKKTFGFFQQVRNGYIVLLPESNPENLVKNPLFKSSLPDFENLTLENSSSTLGKYILDFEHSVREIEKKVTENDTEGIKVFEDVVDSFEESGAQLESTWGLLKTLYFSDSNLLPHDSYMPLHDRARKAKSLKYTSRQIYNLFKASDLSKLTEEEQRVVTKFRLEGKLNGLELGADGSEILRQILNKLARQRYEFAQKYKISSSMYSHDITDTLTTLDFPEHFRKILSLKEPGAEYQGGPWRITTAHANKFLRFCPDRQLRWNTWLAQREIASPKSDSQLSNSTNIEVIRKLRRDMANILGFINYAHFSMETKMAGSLSNVQNMLNALLENARYFQMKEVESLQDFAEDNGFRGKLEMWDLPYWERRQKKELFNWDEKILREYFPYEKVMSGLMDFCAEMFSLRFELSKEKTWHKDVQLYHVYDQESKRPIGGIYVDPYARENKINTPGQVICIRPSARVFGPSMPLMSMIFSLTPPSGDAPCLLEFEEVEQIFKKFGQALQQLLSTANYIEVSGLSFIEWDGVEVVSNVMSLWLNDPTVMEKISGHYKTKEPLPVKSIEDVRRHISGYLLSEEIYKANLDLQLHISTDFWRKIMKNLWPEHFVFELQKDDYHPCSFVQPFAGEFGAAYFSHLWARMLAQDAYSLFLEEKDKKSVGMRFRDTFLSFGGGCHPSEVFRRFRGRDPSCDAFVESIGQRPSES